MSLKIVELEKKLSEAKVFLGLEKDNRKSEKKRLIKDNKKLSIKIHELEEKKLKIVKEDKDETDIDESLIQDLENQIKSLNKRNKDLSMTCA